MNLPPFQLITNAAAWQQCVERLRQAPQIGIDLEANSMFAYRERVCLIQISVPGQDFIVDPLEPLHLAPLGEIIADPTVEKIFHAAEYDLILLKREYGWELNNLFDTMWAGRILGYQRYGLANMLEQLYGVELDKRYQKANWCKRPLTPAHLQYAQLDTHYLLRLRQDLSQALVDTGRWDEAQETFCQQTDVQLPDQSFDPNGFWNLNGTRDLSRQQQAILKELYIFRERTAQRRNQPLFKILSDRTLVELAKAKPTNQQALRDVHGMSNGQIRRYGSKLLQVIKRGGNAPPPKYPKRNKRQPEVVLNRYEKLHNWRKHKGIARGVESDVIVSRQALWDIAQTNPTTQADLAQIESIGTWRSQTYGAEILQLLHKLQ